MAHLVCVLLIEDLNFKRVCWLSCRWIRKAIQLDEEISNFGHTIWEGIGDVDDPIEAHLHTGVTWTDEWTGPVCDVRFALYGNLGGQGDLNDGSRRERILRSHRESVIDGRLIDQFVVSVYDWGQGKATGCGSEGDAFARPFNHIVLRVEYLESEGCRWLCLAWVDHLLNDNVDELARGQVLSVDCSDCEQASSLVKSPCGRRMQ